MPDRAQLGPAGASQTFLLPITAQRRPALGIAGRGGKELLPAVRRAEINPDTASKGKIRLAVDRVGFLFIRIQRHLDHLNLIISKEIAF